jgi:hypothetical protein
VVLAKHVTCNSFHIDDLQKTPCVALRQPSQMIYNLKIRESKNDFLNNINLMSNGKEFSRISTNPIQMINSFHRGIFF